MKYLKLTVQRNRRRIQLEELLLLLLRIALPVLLFFALARPVLSPTGLERWIGRGGRSSEVVLIDDSLSMGYASDEGPALQKALQVAGALLNATPPQDRCTLATASAPNAPVIHDVEASRREELAAAVAGVGQAATHASWPTVLAGLDDVLKSCTYPSRRLTIVTDLRRSGWDSAVKDVAKRWADDKIVVRLVDVGAEGTANVSLQSLAPLDRTILAGAPSAWEAVVKNDSPRARLPRCRPARVLLAAPRRRAAGRLPPMGGRAGEGLAPDPPGRRRALDRAVRVRGRLPRRAAVDRRGLGGGVAGGGRDRSGLPLAPDGDARRPRPGERRRPHARAGRPAASPGPRGDGPDDLPRRADRPRPVQRAVLPPGRPPPPVPVQGHVRPAVPRPGDRARPALAD